MRLHVAHRTVYRYEPPATGVIQVLRLTPRNHEGQYVVRWRIDISADARLAAHEDAFGNVTHVFNADGPLRELAVEVNGEVETQSTDGVVRGAVERFPPSLFLRDTALTQADPAIREFAQKARAGSDGNTLGALHALMDRLHADMARESHSPHPAKPAAEAFAAGRGTARDIAHVFLGAARSLGIPARYVAGYCHAADGVPEEDAGHAWAEACAPDLGWVAFDPAIGMCPVDAHVRVAIGLDSLGAAAARGTRYGAGGETAEVAIKVGQ